jgi:FkbM family methyltransferase
MIDTTRNVTRHGVTFKVHCDSENADFWKLDDWEAGNYAIVKRHASECPAFVNAGGWIGPFTLFAAKLYQQVHSLEPDPVAFAELSRNVMLNGFANTTVENRAFYREKGTIRIGSDHSPIGRSGTSIFQQQNAVVVPCETLRCFFERHEIPSAFLMLDVEGAEWVLFDDTEFFKEHRPIVLLELHLDFLDEQKRSHLAGALQRLKPFYESGLDQLPASGICHRLMIPAS